MFRFDRYLTTEFVRDAYDTLARRTADTIGWSTAESRRVSLRMFHDASKAYFSEYWDDMESFAEANTAALFAIRRRLARRLNVIQGDLDANQQAVTEVNGVGLDILVAEATPERPLLVKVYADYCTTCRALAPEFEAAGRILYGKAVFAALRGPQNLAAQQLLNVTTFPTVIRFTGPGRPAQRFPRDRPRLSQQFVAFATEQNSEASAHVGAFSDRAAAGDSSSSSNENARDSQASITMLQGYADAEELGDEQASTNDPASISAEHDPDPAGGLPGQWAGMLRRQGIDELEELVRDRDAAVHSQIDHALRCDPNGCRMPPERDGDLSRPPVAILLGGGMGSGKTSVVSVLSKTEFWRQRGDSVVVVEADAFKQTDPVYTALSGIGVQKASRIVHDKSVQGAEELLLTAIKHRRDVVFDGTMSWRPFVEQTVAMLRDSEYYYERGPGYHPGMSPDAEVYWVRTTKRDAPVPPYRIEVVGVTVDPPVAVERAVVRALVTGRAAPIEQLLESHRRFSVEFEQYLDLVDGAYLFDMSAEDGAPQTAADGVSTPSDDAGRSVDGGTLQRGIIACKPGLLFSHPLEQASMPTPGSFSVSNRRAYKRFLRKRDINVAARCAAELYMDGGVDAP